MLRKNCLPGAASKASRTQREAARQLSPFGSSCLGDAPIRNTEMPRIRSKPLALHLGLRISWCLQASRAGVLSSVAQRSSWKGLAWLATELMNCCDGTFRILQSWPRIPRNLPAPLPRILQARRGQLSGNVNVNTKRAPGIPSKSKPTKISGAEFIQKIY